MWVNFLMVVLGSYVVVVVGAWGYWFKNNTQAQVVNEWQNVVLTSIVWVNVAQYIAFVMLVIVLRMQRSTFVLVSAKARWSAVSEREHFKIVEEKEQDTQLEQQVDSLVEAAGIPESVDLTPEEKAEQAESV